MMTVNRRVRGNLIHTSHFRPPALTPCSLFLEIRKFLVGDKRNRARAGACIWRVWLRIFDTDTTDKDGLFSVVDCPEYCREFDSKPGSTY